MVGSKVLFDTNVLIRFLNGNRTPLPVPENNEKYVSFLTEIEIFRKPGLTEIERAAIIELLTTCTVLPYSSVAMKESIISLRTKYKLKMPDAFVAAAALHQGYYFSPSTKAFRISKT